MPCEILDLKQGGKYRVKRIKDTITVAQSDEGGSFVHNAQLKEQIEARFAGCQDQWYLIGPDRVAVPGTDQTGAWYEIGKGTAGTRRSRLLADLSKNRQE
jgi:hypothetical protein